MDFRNPLDPPIFNDAFYRIFRPQPKSSTYVGNVHATALIPADIKEYPNKYEFIVDMPGLKSEDIKVRVEDDNMLIISGERASEDEKEGVNYLIMERRVGEIMRTFPLPEDANNEKISAVCQDGVLCVSVEKLPPKKPKNVEVKVA